MNELTQQTHHHNGSGKVVEHGRHKKGQNTDDDQQFLAVFGFDAVGDYFKALVRVDDFDNGHGTE